MIFTPASLRSDHWMLCVGIGGCFQSESLAAFAGIRISVRSTQDTNKVLVALAEEQLINAKRARDAEARAINNDIRFRSEGSAILDAQIADASAAMRAWRMP